VRRFEQYFGALSRRSDDSAELNQFFKCVGHALRRGIFTPLHSYKMGGEGGVLDSAFSAATALADEAAFSGRERVKRKTNYLGIDKKVYHGVAALWDSSAGRAEL